MNRRFFLEKMAKTTATFLFANTAVYVVGAAFSDLDGRLTAGAKGTWREGSVDFADGSRPACSGCGYYIGGPCSPLFTECIDIGPTCSLPNSGTGPVWVCDSL